MHDPLPHQIVADTTPTRWGLVLHGILGSKTNWRTVARRLSAALPSWGFVLPDLRNHGDAQGFAGPHTLDAVANDLDALVHHLDRPIDAVIGHSFGSKAALAYIERHGVAIAHTVLIDGNPGARAHARGSEATLRVLGALDALRGFFDTREAFNDALRARGFTQDLVAWLAMNLVPRDGRYVLRIDVDAIRAMLSDYFARDLWHVLETPPSSVIFDVITGGASTVLDADDRAHFDAIAARGSWLRHTVIEGAGHWVHVDRPKELLDALTRALA
jgi:pimeloyl-ACP methyl ester carboxylesterase